MTEDNQKVIRHSITYFLSRREHGFNELVQKLCQKGHESDDIISVLTQFKDADIQSDVRFAEMHIRNGIQKGQGLQRVRESLRLLRVNDVCINEALKDVEVDWFDLALKVKRKRFGFERELDPKQKAKQQRFLQYRGFSFEQIDHALTSTDDP